MASASSETEATSPQSRACWALIREAVSTWYFARDRPIRRASRWVPPLPGIMPSRISGRANCVRVVARRISVARAISKPTPKQYPSTAVITGLGERAGAVMSWPRSVSS